MRLTGKTRLARKVADIIGSGEMVQFHPARTYEDFVVGLYPHSANGQLVFDVRPGDPLVQLIVTRHRGKQFVELLSQLRRPLRRGILPVHQQLFVEFPVALPKGFQPFTMLRHTRRHALIMATIVNPA